MQASPRMARMSGTGIIRVEGLTSQVEPEPSFR